MSQFAVIERDHLEDIIVKDGKVVATIHYEVDGKSIKQYMEDKHEIRDHIKGAR